MTPTLVKFIRPAARLGLALLAASSVAAAQEGRPFFSGEDLRGWSADRMGYWSVEDGAIVGHSDIAVPSNEFLWWEGEVSDFFLAVDVKLTPGNANAGIQFRSRKTGTNGQAAGYQADVGEGLWGKLYHEHGRGKLDWNDRANGIVNEGGWNRYEILAIGHRIWTAVNGTLCVAIEDPDGELSGKIAFQIHSGPPQTVRYRIVDLVHDPEPRMTSTSEQELLAALPVLPQALAGQTPRPGWTPQVIAWREKLDLSDPGLSRTESQPWSAADHDDGQWSTMVLPGHWEQRGLPDFDGTVWYRKSVDLPASLAGHDLVLELGPIDDMDMAWFNGVQVGGIERPGFWAKPRRYAIPSELVEAGRNVIAVRAIDHGFSGGFAGSPAQMRLTGSGTNLSLAGEWRYRSGVELKSLGLGALENPSPAARAIAFPELPPLVRALERPFRPVPGFTDGFAIDGDQTIVLLGGTNALSCSRSGYLETLLTAAHPGQRLRLRNMAWQADTVYRQQRPRNFHAQNVPDYGEGDGRARTTADIVFLWMGQAEALDGLSQLDQFAAAYGERVEQIAAYTGRIVLITPVPIEDPLGLGLELEERNESLAAYVEAMKRIGRERGLPVVDLFEAMRSRGGSGYLTRNGLHLTPAGQWLAARVIVEQLGVAEKIAPVRWQKSDATLDPASFEALRKSIARKNDLWLRHWRPANWAFLYGNRQTQPSSHDHTNGASRWFPVEVQALLGHIEQAETEIHELVENLARTR
jgi:hypothetical protein